MGGSSPSHTFNTPGTYTVMVSVTDANGQRAESSMTVRVAIKDTDGDGIADTSDLCPTISGTLIGNGCPAITGILGRLENNTCILKKVKTQ